MGLAKRWLIAWQATAVKLSYPQGGEMSLNGSRRNALVSSSFRLEIPEIPLYNSATKFTFGY